MNFYCFSIIAKVRKAYSRCEVSLQQFICLSKVGQVALFSFSCILAITLNMLGRATFFIDYYYNLFLSREFYRAWCFDLSSWDIITFFTIVQRLTNTRSQPFLHRHQYRAFQCPMFRSVHCHVTWSHQRYYPCLGRHSLSLFRRRCCGLCLGWLQRPHYFSLLHQQLRYPIKFSSATVASVR